MTTVLVIAPHADDEVLGCGGTMVRHASLGDDVHVLVITRGMSALFEEEKIEAIRAELSEAHRLLGVASVSFLDFPAPKLDAVPIYQLADAIREVLSTLKPETVYLPHHGDLHLDHRRTYQAALVAARPIDGCSVRRMLAYETLSETEWGPPTPECAFIPTVFVDISRYLDKKAEAMACYRSQIRAFPHSRSLEALRALGALRGSAVGLAAAEAFMLVREVVR